MIGAWLATAIWGGAFPGSDAFIGRLYIVHVLIIPVVIGALLTTHLAIIVRQKHAQFRGPGRTERNVVGLRLWPAYALRSGGLLLAVTGVLFLLGGLIQINPIWQWGPFEPYLATNGAQPDWYLGWLLGALRLMPGWELHIGSYTLIPNPFFGGLLFPLAAFALLYLWPSVERRRTGDDRRHDLLDAPSDAPRRTGAICAATAVVGVVFLAGSADRIAVAVHISYVTQIWILRVAVFVLPVAVYYLVRGICLELQERGRVTPSNQARELVRVERPGAVDPNQLAAEVQRLPLAGGRERHDLVCRFGVVVHRVTVRVAVEKTLAQHFGRRRDVHLRDPCGREVAEDDALRDEVPLADQRDVVREQLMHDRRHQVEDGDAELVRLVAPVRAELRGERLLECVLRDERQAELVAEQRGRRRLARTGGPGDDD